MPCTRNWGGDDGEVERSRYEKLGKRKRTQSKPPRLVKSRKSRVKDSLRVKRTRQNPDAWVLGFLLKDRCRNESPQKLVRGMVTSSVNRRRLSGVRAMMQLE